jgi:hypothetical protein
MACLNNGQSAIPSTGELKRRLESTGTIRFDVQRRLATEEPVAVGESLQRSHSAA